ncbi:HAD-like domain-containing protein [Xylariaceae sp. FL1272]|nr:HAD-like domain-containing protein [Xylariaceae sp. FL1272]
MSAPCLSGDPSRIREFVDKFDTFLVDCDGVILDADRILINESAKALKWLQGQGKRIIIVTNGDHSRRRLAANLKNQGLEIPQTDIMTSAYTTVMYIRRNTRPKQRHPHVYLVGGGFDELDDNYNYVRCVLPSTNRGITRDDYEELIKGNLKWEGRLEAVVTGNYDEFTYRDICYAAHYIRTGLPHLATSLDATYSKEGTLFPGAGCIAAAISYASGKEPILMGKPGNEMMSLIQSEYNLNDEALKRTCMIGDSIDSDIQFAYNGRLGGSLLVLTGVSKEEDAKGEKARGLQLTAYVQKLGDLDVDLEAT